MQTENILNDSRLRALENHTRVNLLRPTMGTTTQNGVTCTNNGDGTYTLNGTATVDVSFVLLINYRFKSGTYKFIGLPNSDKSYVYVDMYGEETSYVRGKSFDFTIARDGITRTLRITILKNGVCNNILVKPMLTDDLSATYDDFVSYEDSLQPGINTGLQMDLLWTNASPTSAFSEQTISLDLSKYNLVFVDFIEKSGGGFYCCALLNKGITKAVGYICSSNLKTMIRQVKITDSYLEFKDAWITSTSSDNNYLIPYKIYGVK